jgi:hypothetical protein
MLFAVERLLWLCMSPAERERCRQIETRVREEMRQERLDAIRRGAERRLEDLAASERLRRERFAEMLRAREAALRNTFFPHRRPPGPGVRRDG